LQAAPNPEEAAFVLGPEEARRQEELRASYLAPLQICPRPATLEAPKEALGDLYGALVLEANGGAYVAHKIGRSKDFQLRQAQLDEEARLHGKAYDHTIIAVHKECGALERFVHAALAESRLSEDGLKEYFLLPRMSGPEFQVFLRLRAEQALLQWNLFRKNERERGRRMLGDDAHGTKRRKLDIALQAFQQRKELETKALELETKALELETKALELKLAAEEELRQFEMEQRRLRAVAEEEQRRLQKEKQRRQAEAEEEQRHFEMEQRRLQAEAELEQRHFEMEQQRKRSAAEEEQRRLRNEGLELENAKRRLELLALQRGLSETPAAPTAPTVPRVPKAWSDCVVVAEDGFINATRMAKAFRKKSNDYTRRLRGQTLLAALQARIPGPPLLRAHGGAHTWIHPSVAVDYADWLDVNFGTWFATQQRGPPPAVASAPAR